MRQTRTLELSEAQFQQPTRDAELVRERLHAEARRRAAVDQGERPADELGGWRWAFGLFGAVGILWAFALAFLLRDTPQPVAAAGAAIFGFGFATGVYDSNLYASLLDVVSPRYRAAAVGIFGCGGNVLGALGPGLIGWLNGRLGMRASLASLAAFALVGAAVILVARFAWRRGRRAKADA